MMINIQKRTDLTSSPKKEDKEDIKIIKTRPHMKSKKEDKQDIEMNEN